MPQNYPYLDFHLTPNPLKRIFFRALRTSHGAGAASSPLPPRQGRTFWLDQPKFKSVFCYSLAERHGPFTLGLLTPVSASTHGVV